ncbi:unnamed protein product, partial [Aphanomyces euteiches]
VPWYGRALLAWLRLRATLIVATCSRAPHLMELSWNAKTQRVGDAARDFHIGSTTPRMALRRSKHAVKMPMEIRSLISAVAQRRPQRLPRQLHRQHLDAATSLPARSPMELSWNAKTQRVGDAARDFHIGSTTPRMALQRST